MAAGDVRTAHFEPEPASGPLVRRMLTDHLDGAIHDEAAENAALCASELATNAVLHARTPFEVALRTVPDGVRIDVIDGRPAEVPEVVPGEGTAADILARSPTGRGLRIVAAIATRWGVSTSDASKCVWAECRSTMPEAPTRPIVELGHRLPQGRTMRVTYLSLPVRAAVASGVQVDALVREAQIGPLATEVDAGVRARLFELLDASAAPRLAGRHAALRASAAFRDRYDLVLEASPDAMRATAELRRLLGTLTERLDEPTFRIGPAVAAFRDWLQREAMAQAKGDPPTPCPLPAA